MSQEQGSSAIRGTASGSFNSGSEAKMALVDHSTHQAMRRPSDVGAEADTTPGNPTSSAVADGGLSRTRALLRRRLRSARPSAVVAAVRRRMLGRTESGAELRERMAKLEKRLKRQARHLRAERQRANDLKELLGQTRSELSAHKRSAAERRDKQQAMLIGTRDRLAAKTALWDAARRYFALFRQGLLYDEIEKSSVDFSADTYLCLLPSTVPAGMALRRKFGGRVVCDCVENVEVERHSLAPNLHPPALEMVNLTAYGALTKVDGIMTVSNSVARTLSRYGPPVRVQPNYRRFEPEVVACDLRARFGIPSDATVLVTSGNIVEGFETVLDAVALLPVNIHLIALARFSPASYGARVHQHLDSLGLAERVHLVGFVPYDELAGFLAGADLGLITLDPDNPNHSVSLPNRVFDFLTAGLPFVAPPLHEIEEHVRAHGCGSTIAEVSPAAWAEEIARSLGRLSEMRQCALRARAELTWESLDDGLIDFLGAPRTVTLLGFRDLTRYQRFLRVARSLTQRGIKVKAVFFSEDPLPVDVPGAEYYHFSNRYGVGAGLTLVGNDVPCADDADV